MPKDKEDRYIPGIYNYCDRWCERCAFTHRCRNFSMRDELEKRATGKGKDDEDEDEGGNDREFWEQLDSKDAPTSGEINDLAAGMDMEFAEEELEEAGREVRRKRKEARQVGASALQTAEAYTWRLHEFLKKHPELHPARDEDIDTKSPLKHATPADKGDAALLHDALEVITWHEFFIFVKLQRAFGSLVHEKEHSPDWPRDSDGSAKVVLIGLDRCLAAWEVVRKLLPEHAPAAVDFMLRLDRLRSKVEAHFPKARAFVRPGFDDKGLSDG